jgi:exopolysaccharide biosynthesis polyprenyl glycosylphosphotransferase
MSLSTWAGSLGRRFPTPRLAVPATDRSAPRGRLPISFSVRTRISLAVVLAAIDLAGIVVSVAVLRREHDDLRAGMVAFSCQLLMTLAAALGAYAVRSSAEIAKATWTRVVITAAVAALAGYACLSRADEGGARAVLVALAIGGGLVVGARVATMLLAERVAWRLCERVVALGRSDRIAAFITAGQLDGERVTVPAAIVVGDGCVPTRTLGRVQSGFPDGRGLAAEIGPLLRSIDRIVILRRDLTADDVQASMQWLERLSHEVHLVGACEVERTEDGSEPISSIVVRRPRLTERELFVKRSIDILVSAVALTVTLPALLLIALLIRLESRGPALFRQTRLGYNNLPFTMYKFRTMAIGESDGRQAVRGDSRVTRVGAFLRRTSIDELPQLLNVLGGSMSLVGPRPHPLWLNEGFAPLIRNYAARHSVPPGITGWAQVHGYRGETSTVTDMRDRVEMDLDYIRRRSILFDLKIIVKTVSQVFSMRNAY